MSFFPHEVYNYVITSVALADVTTPSPAPYSSTRAPSPFFFVGLPAKLGKKWPGGSPCFHGPGLGAGVEFVP